MSNKEDLPDVSFTESVVAFIETLDTLYPHRCIGRGEDMIDAQRYSAVREFIDGLVAMKNEYVEGEDEDSRDDS